MGWSPEWLMAIECQCSWHDSHPAWLIGYRASVWSGSASYTVVSPNQLVYSQRFPLPPTPLFSFVFFPPSPAVNVNPKYVFDAVADNIIKIYIRSKKKNVIRAKRKVIYISRVCRKHQSTNKCS